MVSEPLSSILQDRLIQSGSEWIESPGGDREADANHVATVAEQLDAGWVVVDGYAFDVAWQRHVAERRSLLVIDDHGHLPEYDCHLLLNPNPVEPQSLYRGRYQGEILHGPRFALLQPAFRQAREKQSPIAATQDHSLQLLVTFGGTAPEALTDRVMKALAAPEFRELSITVLGGRRLSTAGDSPVRWLDFTSHMPTLLQETDLAICGGGSTNWEMCCLGIPRLIVALADNQLGIASALHDAGAAIYLGWHSEITADEVADALSHLVADANARQSMASVGRTLVDGAGAERVVRRLLDSC